MQASTQQLLRSLPSVSALLDEADVRDWLDEIPRPIVLEALQTALESVRDGILAGRSSASPDVDALLAEAEAYLHRRLAPSLKSVINATGIVLHTGLGRAPLCEDALDALMEGAAGYCNLEWNLERGERGRRSVHVAEELSRLTGAESATVVNNNAAATYLILRTFAAGREVVVSRGQLVEIGGSFRLPEILEASGARLKEVGTTNRTRVSDYENAITERTAILMRVHPSNYRVVGFSEEVSLRDLASLAHRRGLIAVDDLGSGALVDFAALGLPEEPCVRASIEAEADLVCFSGDKLVGGPQCGVIVGRREAIERLEADPLMRTYRVGKLTLLALEATLRQYADPQAAAERIPALAMLRGDTPKLAERARRLVEQLEAALSRERFLTCSDVGYAGGGSLPTESLETVVVQWRPEKVAVDEAVAALRTAETPVVARVRDGAICFDLRTIRDVEFDALVASVVHSATADSGGSGEDRGEGLSLPVL